MSELKGMNEKKLRETVANVLQECYNLDLASVS